MRYHDMSPIKKRFTIFGIILGILFIGGLVTSLLDIGGVNRGGETIGAIIVIAGFAVFSAWFFRRKAKELGLDYRRVRNITITAAIPCWGWAFAWLYIVCYKYEINFWFWMWMLVIMASSVIGLFIWIPLFLIKVREAKEAAKGGDRVTIDPETGIHTKEYVPPAELRHKSTPPSEWR